MNEELAIISGVGVGLRDTSRPVVWFSARTLHYGALIVWSWDDAAVQITANGISNVLDLNGRACVVTTHGGIMTFARLFPD